VEQVKNRVSGTKDKAEELDQIVKNPDKMLKKYERNLQQVWIGTP
jgi:flagellar assembly factor FliW